MRGLHDELRARVAEVSPAAEAVATYVDDLGDDWRHRWHGEEVIEVRITDDHA
jgi:hypothetical protein